MFGTNKKLLKELEDLEWIFKMNKETVGDMDGYYIQFFDKSFIVGNIKKSEYHYIAVKKNAHISGIESMAELFVNFISCRFESEKASEGIIKEMFKVFKHDPNKESSKMTLKQLEAEMLDAAQNENFERAAELKKKMENYEF